METGLKHITSKLTMSRPAIIQDYDEENPSCMLTHSTGDARLPQHPTADHIPNISDPSFLLVFIRERDGRCADCGIQTHHFQTNRFTHKSQKVPFTIRNEVYRGRCLLCHPLPYGHQDSRRRHGAQSTPYKSHYSHIDDHDDSSELSSIMYAMREFPLDEDNQGVGCEAMWVHSWDDEASSTIGRLGGIDLIINAMINFPENTHIQLCACGALENLACDSRNCSLIVDAGGNFLVAQAMMRHVNENTLAVYGMRTLEALGRQGATSNQSNSV
jgi:hypothetical protein